MKAPVFSLLLPVTIPSLRQPTNGGEIYRRSKCSGIRHRSVGSQVAA